MAKKDAPLSVELPPAGADRPAWGKVGLIAATGFAFGIIWPPLTHTRIAPNPPSDAPASLPGPSASVVAPPPPASSAPPAPTDQGIAVSEGVIVRCRDGKDESKSECGSLEFDPVAIPKIKALAQCPAAGGLAGKLSIGFDVDFHKKTVKVQLGKSTTLPRDKADALLRCADTAFDKVSLAEVPHQHRRYSIFYMASFSTRAAGSSNDKPEGDKSAPERPAVEGPVAGTTTSESPASGTATVGWDVAIVRETPKTGAIVARLLRGSKVKVIAHQGEWYRIQHGSAEGWVYRGTIGL